MKYVLTSSNGYKHEITIIPARHHEDGARRLSVLAKEGLSCSFCKEVLALEEVVEDYAKNHLQGQAIETAYVLLEIGQGHAGPKIGQSPSLAFGTVKKGSSPSRHITIKNPNSVSLSWSASVTNETAPQGWVNLGPTVSPIPASASVTLDVTLNTSGLTVGHTYTATLVASSAFGSDSAPISVTIS